jgi:hypothetical protein
VGFDEPMDFLGLESNQPAESDRGEQTAGGPPIDGLRRTRQQLGYVLRSEQRFGSIGRALLIASRT